MKRITVTLITAAMLLTLAGCAQNNSSAADSASQTTSQTDSTSADTSKADDTADNADSAPSDDSVNTNVSPADIEQKIADALGDNYLCNTDFDDEWFKNYYQFDMSQIDEYVAKQNLIASVNPDTVIILKVKDGYADTAVDLLNSAYDQQVSYIRQYPFGVQKVMNARIYKIGNYVIYALAGEDYSGEDSDEELKVAEEGYEKIDAAIESVFGSVPENLAIVPEDDGNSNNGFFNYTLEDDDSYYYYGTYEGDYDDMPVVGG